MESKFFEGSLVYTSLITFNLDIIKLSNQHIIILTYVLHLFRLERARILGSFSMKPKPGPMRKSIFKIGPKLDLASWDLNLNLARIVHVWSQTSQNSVYVHFVIFNNLNNKDGTRPPVTVWEIIPLMWAVSVTVIPPTHSNHASSLGYNS